MDIAERQYFTEGPDRSCVADITYIPTRLGIFHLAMVPNLYSRRIMGWPRFNSQAEAKLAVFEWIEGWYSPSLRHPRSVIGRQPIANARITGQSDLPRASAARGDRRLAVECLKTML